MTDVNLASISLAINSLTSRMDTLEQIVQTIRPLALPIGGTSNGIKQKAWDDVFGGDVYHAALMDMAREKAILEKELITAKGTVDYLTARNDYLKNKNEQLEAENEWFDIKEYGLPDKPGKYLTYWPDGNFAYTTYAPDGGVDWCGVNLTHWQNVTKPEKEK
jgi:hypothetical protein